MKKSYSLNYEQLLEKNPPLFILTCGLILFSSTNLIDLFLESLNVGPGISGLMIPRVLIISIILFVSYLAGIVISILRFGNSIPMRILFQLYLLVNTYCWIVLVMTCLNSDDPLSRKVVCYLVLSTSAGFVYLKELMLKNDYEKKDRGISPEQEKS